MTKPLTGALDKDLPTPINVNIDTVKMMTAYNHQRDKAVGLRLSKHTRGLVWYGENKQRELSKEFLQAAVTKGAIDEISKQIKEIIHEAETSQPDEKRKAELFSKARALQKMARKIGRKNGLY